MTVETERIAAAIDRGHELSKKGLSRDAAEYYLEAAQLADRNLKSNRLQHLCIHNYLLELLTAENGQNRILIQRIIQNLKWMKENIDDDDMRIQIAPLINFFEALEFSVGEDDDPMDMKIQSLRNVTDTPQDFFNTVAHILTDIIYVVESIRPYKHAIPISMNEFNTRKQHLIDCIQARIKHANMPDVLRRILHEFEIALLNAENPENVERAINIFKNAISNHNNKILQISIDTMAPYIYAILNGNSSIEREKHMTLSSNKQDKLAWILGIFFAASTFVLLIIVFFWVFIGGQQMQSAAARILSVICGFGAACGLGFIGGSLTAKGTIAIPLSKNNKVSFNAMGGIGALIVITLLVWWILRA